ncbi:unnamed protein product [Adineta steineri]|uniref:Sodium-dependent glucose transporter 1-like protein n=1 Tax=Adineta steineri TaxID=433720 RepID=A0A813QJR3_9BILA|nr:unnamed protein product [Adineta steineri]CAF3487354.1 unnamed protein product [Adineta steineri]
MSNEVNKTGLKVYSSRPYELVKTSFLILTWVVLGVHLEICGPTLTILAARTGVLLSGISTILVARNAGYVTGNIAGALVQKIVKKYPELLLSISFLIAATVLVVTPLIHNLVILSILFFFQGISQGVTDLGGTSLMLAMWGDNAAAPLNAVHLGYGFGAVFANVIVKPFLREDITTPVLEDSTRLTISETSNIQTPYSISAGLCLLICIGHCIFAIREQRIQREALRNRSVEYSSVSTTITNEKKMEIETKNVSQYSPKSCGKGFFTYGLLMSIVLIFYMFFLSGNDQTFGKFFFAFVKSPEFGISTNGATWYMILYWLSYSVGRLICMVITVYIPVHLCLIGLWVFGLSVAVGWYIFVWQITLTSTSLLILGAFTGLIFSPTFPLSFGFLNQRLNTNPLLIGLLLCGSASGGMFFQKIGGIVLDTNRKHFPTLLIICVIFSIILFSIAFIISTIYEKKINSKKNLNNTIPINKQNLPISEEEQQMEKYLTKTEQL